MGPLRIHMGSAIVPAGCTSGSFWSAEVPVVCTSHPICVRCPVGCTSEPLWVRWVPPSESLVPPAPEVLDLYTSAAVCSFGNSQKVAPGHPYGSAGLPVGCTSGSIWVHWGSSRLHQRTYMDPLGSELVAAGFRYETPALPYGSAGVPVGYISSPYSRF